MLKEEHRTALSNASEIAKEIIQLADKLRSDVSDTAIFEQIKELAAKQRRLINLVNFETTYG